MNSKVQKTVFDNNLINRNDTVYAAVSGGADSSALLYVLNDIRSKIDFDLKCVHINHLLRGDESDRDEQFVRDTCKKLGIECVVHRVDVNALSSASGDSVELAARKARYEIFESLSGKVATAHTKNDRAETLLMNLARGSGLSGLNPIPIKRQNIIRPLLECSRDEVEKYLKSNGIEWVTDSTNLTDDYTRNRVRHNLIPLFEELNPAFLESVQRLSDTVGGAVEHLRNMAEQIGDSAELAQKADDAVLCEYVRMNCERFSKTPDKMHTKLAAKVLREGGKTQIFDDLFLEVSQGKIGFFKKYPDYFECDFSLSTVKTPYSTLKFEKISDFNIKNCPKIHNLLFKFCFDYDKIIEHIIIRSKKESDAVRLYGRGCTKSLRRLYNEAKIPVFERGKYAVLSDGDNIIWAQGFGVSESYAVDENTKNAVLITEIFKGDDFHKR